MDFKPMISNALESFRESKVFWSVAVVAVLFMIIGILVGNPFETYSNASTL